jgi:hypothetical protein
MNKGLLALATLVISLGCSHRSDQAASANRSAADSRSAVEAAGNATPIATGEPAPLPDPGAVTRASLPPIPSTQPEPSNVPAAVSDRSPQAERGIVIPAGTSVRVRLAQTVDTKRWRAGQSFHAHLAAPVTVDGRVIVPRGTLFIGHIVESKPSGRLKGRATISLALDSFRMDGHLYPIATAVDARASRSHKKRNLAFIGGGSGGGAAIGGIAGGGVGALIGAGGGAAAGTTTALITGRKQVTLPVETPMVFTLRNRVRVGS